MDEQNAALISIDNLSVEYHTEIGVKHAVNNFSLNIAQGESLGLVGESGAGKTTTALSILRLLPKDSARLVNGVIKYKGLNMADFSRKKMEDIRGKEISMIFQNPLTSLNPVFTVGEQIAMVFRKHKGLTKMQALIEAGNMMDIVGISKERIGDYPHQFSGGMRQRIGIAAALACDPELLIADEPTTALDVTIQAQILELMKSLQARYRMSLMMITHNLGIIAELCSNVAVVYAGRVIEYGSVEEVFQLPLHPYTKGLLGAIPNLHDEKTRLAAIYGSIADPYILPIGCSFAPRCSQCISICNVKKPELAKISEKHYVECWCYGEVKLDEQ